MSATYEEMDRQNALIELGATLIDPPDRPLYYFEIGYTDRHPRESFGWFEAVSERQAKFLCSRLHKAAKFHLLGMIDSRLHYPLDVPIQSAWDIKKAAVI